MRLVRLSFVIFILAALNSCADIIPLPGGNRDESAPVPTSITPEPGATGIKPTEAKLTFNEYITLKDPGTSITMSPDVGPITATQDKKTITVSWTQPLKEETTYILSLNGTVRDLNEGNDSIIQVVFSTGSFIDSLEHTGKITSAYSGEMLQNATICLYETDSIPFVNQPSYFVRSDKGGNYQFNYIHQGEYQLFAFQDANKNGKVDGAENIAFDSEALNMSDTIPSKLRMFKPKTTQNKLKIAIEKPGTATISGVNFDSTVVTINGENLIPMNRFRFDSLRVALPYSENDNYRFIARNDTIGRKHVVSDRKANFAIKLEGNKLRKPGDTLNFSVNEFLRKVDTSALKLLNDYGKPVVFQVMVENGKLKLIPQTQENFTVIFGKNAVFGERNANDTISFKIETYTLERCGDLSLDVTSFEGNWIFELIDNANTEQGKVVQSKKGNGAKLVFNGLIPGQYSIRCFKDENSNSVWDSGDYSKKIQPEIMLRFPVKQKIRANWEIEETLSPN